MNDEMKQLVDAARRIALTSSEKRQIFNSVAQYVNSHSSDSVRADVSGRQQYWSRVITQTLTRRIHFMQAIIIIGLLAGGTVTLAAEGSLPGDTLYPVKTLLTENVLSALSLGDKADASLEVRLATRRLEEAESLAAEGRLDDETRSTLETEFESHARNVEARIQELETKEDFTAAVDIGSHFEASLRAHKRVISDANVSSSTRRNLDSLTHSVLMKIQTTEDGRAHSEARVRSDTAIERDARRSGARASKDLESTTRYVQRRKDHISADVYSDVAARLESASTIIIDGNAKIEVGNYQEAFSLFQSALRSIEESQHLVEVHMRADRHNEPSGNGSSDTTDDNGKKADVSSDETTRSNKKGNDGEDDETERHRTSSSTDNSNGRKDQDDADKKNGVGAEVEIDIETEIHSGAGSSSLDENDGHNRFDSRSRGGVDVKISS